MAGNWLPVVVTVAPASEPVTVDEVKEHLRVDGSDEDALIGTYVSAAREFVEQYTGTKLVSQTLLLQGSSFDLCYLPAAPVISVTSVKYLDTDGAEQTLSTDVYEVVNTGLEPHIRLKVNQTYPSIRDASDAVRVTAVAGYPDVPDAVRAALFLIIASWFDSRSVGPVPEGAVSLLANYRRF